MGNQKLSHGTQYFGHLRGKLVSEAVRCYRLPGR